MSISNVNPQPRDVVIYQRDDTNSYWGEAHISGSNLIFYIDAQGHINADVSSSFYTLFPTPSGSGGGGSGTTLVTGGLYPITSSWAVSASWAPGGTGGSGTTLVTGGLYQITASWALNANATLITGTLYPITASWSQTSSWAVNVINAILSTFAISASFASSSISSSFVNVLTTASNAEFYVPFVMSSSYQRIFIDPSSIYYNPGTDTLRVNNISASSVTASLFGNATSANTAISSAWADTASWALNAINGGTTLTTASTVPITASWSQTSSVSIVSLTASFVTSSNVFGTVGNATRAGTADTASYITSSNIVGIVSTASIALNAISASSVVTASFALNFNPNATASYANQSGTASFAYTSSFALNFNPSATASFANQSGTSSLANTASYAFTASFMNASMVFISSSIQNNNYTYWTSISGSGQAFTLVTASNLVDSGSFAVLTGTSSWARNTVTSSTSTSASFASNALTSSAVNFLMNNDTSSFYIPFVSSGSRGVFTGSGQVMYVDTSSIIYNPGLNLLTVNNISASTITSSLLGTASVAIIAQTASLLLGSVVSASFASIAATASYVNSANIDGTSMTASWALNVVNVQMDIIQIQVFS